MTQLFVGVKVAPSCAYCKSDRADAKQKRTQTRPMVFPTPAESLIHLLRLPHNLVNGLGKVVDIVCIQTSHRDAAILGHVHM